MTGEKDVDDIEDMITESATAAISESDGNVFDPTTEPIVTSETSFVRVVPSYGGSQIMTGNVLLMISCAILKFTL
jgi:hypothetical protein